MHLSIDEAELCLLLRRQIENLLPDGSTPSKERVERAMNLGLERTRSCFSQILVKGYRSPDGLPMLSHLHTGQYGALLYFVSAAAHADLDDDDLATRCYMLNKQLNALDVYFEVALPESFFWEHPVGTVLGRASYGSRFAVYQRCTVGGNIDLDYPVIGTDVTLFAGSSVIGRSVVGENTMISTGAIVVNEVVPPGSLVFGVSPNLVIKPRAEVRSRLFVQVV